MNIKNLKVGDKLKLVKPLEMAMEFVPNGTIATVTEVDISPATEFFKEMVKAWITYDVPTKWGTKKRNDFIRQDDLNCGYVVKVFVNR